MTNASHTVTRDEARAVRDEKGKKIRVVCAAS